MTVESGISEAVSGLEHAAGQAAEKWNWQNPRMRQLASMGAAELVCAGVSAVALGALYSLGCSPPAQHAPEDEAHAPTDGKKDFVKAASAHHLPAEARKTCPAPGEKAGPLEAVNRILANAVFKPLLPMMEGIDRFLSGLWVDGFRQREKMSAEQRAREYLNNTETYGGAFAAGFTAKLFTRDWLNSALRAPMSRGHGTWVLAVDEGVHLGAIALMNSVFSKQTNDLTAGLSSMLQKAGLSKEQADNIALYTVVMEGPNAIGFAAASHQILKGDPHAPVAR